MAKYETAFKVKVVKSLLAGDGGAKVLAARRLDQHCYGTCLECGAAIELERLLALPSTAYCLACQTRHET